MPSFLERRRRDQQIVRGFTCGKDVVELSEEFELTPATIKRVLKSYEDVIELAEMKKTDVVTNLAAERMKESLQTLQEKSMEFVENVIDIATDDEGVEARTRLSALFGLLDRAGISKREAVGEDRPSEAPALPPEVINNFFLALKNLPEPESVDYKSLPSVEGFEISDKSKFLKDENKSKTSIEVEYRNE